MGKRWSHWLTIPYNAIQVASIPFIIPFKPKAQARARAGIIGKGGNARATVFKPRENALVEEEIRRCWLDMKKDLPQDLQDRLPWDGPVRMVVLFDFAQVKDFWEGREKDSKPDMDNCLKMLQDALNGYAWKDDAMIVGKHVEKSFQEKDGTRVLLELYSRVEKPPKKARTKSEKSVK